MRKISTLLLIVAAFQVSAQSYRPFPDAGYFWNEEHGHLQQAACASSAFEYHTCDIPVFFGTDTTIGSVVYHQLKYRQVCDWQLIAPGSPCPMGGNYSLGEALFACIRQDTALRQVFIYDLLSSTEMLLYDFSLAAGDTLPPAYNNSGYPNTVVVRVDSIQLSDGYHRRFVLNVPTFGQDSAALIEGIGSTFGLLADLIAPFENHDILLCFADSTQTIYPNATASCQLTLGVPPVVTGSFEVYPNPFNDMLSLRPGLPGDGHAEIFSSDGRLMLSGDVPSIGIDLDVSHWPGGLYFLRYAGQVNTVQKLVKY